MKDLRTEDAVEVQRTPEVLPNATPPPAASALPRAPTWSSGGPFGRTLLRDGVWIGMIETEAIAKEIAATLNTVHAARGGVVGFSRRITDELPCDEDDELGEAFVGGRANVAVEVGPVVRSATGLPLGRVIPREAPSTLARHVERLVTSPKALARAWLDANVWIELHTSSRWEDVEDALGELLAEVIELTEDRCARSMTTPSEGVHPEEKHHG